MNPTVFLVYLFYSVIIVFLVLIIRSLTYSTLSAGHTVFNLGILLFLNKYQSFEFVFCNTM